MIQTMRNLEQRWFADKKSRATTRGWDLAVLRGVNNKQFSGYTEEEAISYLFHSVRKKYYSPRFSENFLQQQNFFYLNVNSYY